MPLESVAKECREYTTTAIIGGQEKHLKGTACLQSDGSWAIISLVPKLRDHDEAKAAVTAGHALPLDEILARLPKEYKGKLLDVLLYRNSAGIWHYELQMLTIDGVMRDVIIEASTGNIAALR